MDPPTIVDEDMSTTSSGGSESETEESEEGGDLIGAGCSGWNPTSQKTLFKKNKKGGRGSKGRNGVKGKKGGSRPKTKPKKKPKKGGGRKGKKAGGVKGKGKTSHRYLKAPVSLPVKEAVWDTAAAWACCDTPDFKEINAMPLVRAFWARVSHPRRLPNPSMCRPIAVTRASSNSCNAISVWEV